MVILIPIAALLAVVSASSMLEDSPSYKVLVYNVKFGHSHSHFMGSVADILVEAGHKVTTIVSEIDLSLADGTVNSTIIRVPQNNDAGKIWQGLVTTSIDPFKGEEGLFWSLSVGPLLGKMFTLQCETLLDQPGLVEYLTNEKFDVMITETFDFCGVGLYQVIKPKALITASSTVLFESAARDLGVPETMSYNPSFGMANFNIHSLIERVKNIFMDYANRRFFHYTRENIYKLFHSRIGADAKTMSELISQSSFHITNSDAVLDFARPLLRKIVECGGIGARDPQPLDEDWDEVLSRREKNVLVSFGSVARSFLMPIEMKRGLVKAFSLFPDVTFIWKYEMPDDEFVNTELSKLDNVVLSPWMPQNSLLHDPRITGFISHAGMGSVMEAGKSGTPAIFIPLFADQPRNANMMKFAGIGIVYDKRQLKDGDKLALSIQHLLTNQRMHAESARMAGVLAHRNPRADLVRTVEMAAAYGPLATLTPLSLELSFVERNMLDLYACIAALGIAGLLVALKFSNLSIKIGRKSKIE